MAKLDYRSFLGKSETLVLPYLGGASVDAPDRRLRVTHPAGNMTPGWWRFELYGKQASPLEVCDPPDLSALERARGHTVVMGWHPEPCAYLFRSGKEACRMDLLPVEEPPPLSPASARVWHGGDLLFEALDFEEEVESRARERLAERGTIADLKAVSASLRAAFGFALLVSVGRQMAIPVRPREVLAELKRVAEHGEVAAVAVLHGLEERREQERRRMALARGERPMPRVGHARRRSVDPADAIFESLASAGAALRTLRRLEGDLLEVGFQFMGERFISVVHAHTLGVIDSGICLQGADQELTLDSLPSAIREAIECDMLHITRV